jgi:hypothetical protein
MPPIWWRKNNDTHTDVVFHAKKVKEIMKILLAKYGKIKPKNRHPDGKMTKTGF